MWKTKVLESAQEYKLQLNHLEHLYSSQVGGTFNLEKRINKGIYTYTDDLISSPDPTLFCISKYFI